MTAEIASANPSKRKDLLGDSSVTTASNRFHRGLIEEEILLWSKETFSFEVGRWRNIAITESAGIKPA